MNWEAFGAIAEGLGALGVVATLIYFSIQLQKNAQQMRMQNLRGQATEMQLRASFQAQPEVLEVLEKCYEQGATELTFQEATIMEAYFESQFATTIADYSLYKEGLIDKSAWRKQLASTCHLISAAWMQVYWSTVKDVYDPDLVSLIDERAKRMVGREYLSFMGIHKDEGGDA